MKKSVTSNWIRTKFTVTGHSKAALVVRALDRIAAQPDLLSALIDDPVDDDPYIGWRNEGFRVQLEWAKGEFIMG